MNPGGSSGGGTGGGDSGTLERTQSQYERKIARRQQLDLMESTATGMVVQPPNYEPPSVAVQQPPAPDFLNEAPATTSSTMIGTPEGLRSRETARRFLYDEDDEETAHIMKTNVTTPTGIAAKDLFEKRDYNPNAGINLMDHNIADYKTKTPAYATGYDNGTSSSTSFTKRMGQYLFPVTTGTEKEGIMTDDGYFASPDKRQRVTVWGSICNDKKKRRRLMCLLFSIIMIVILSVSLSRMDHIPGIPNEAAQEAKARQYKASRYDGMLDIMLRSGTTVKDQLLEQEGVEYMALRWISYTDPAQLDPSDPSLYSAIIQRYAMAVFYYDSYMEFQQHFGEQTSIGNMSNHNEQTIGLPNPGWHRKDNWMSEMGICMWYGVHCEEQIVNGARITQYNENGNVTSIILSENNVYGSLPRELVAFKSLLTLDLSMNELRETIPYHMGDMYHLQFLYLQQNQLTGTLSTRLGQMYGLKEFYVSDNNLIGTIPIEFNRLYHIKTLALDQNDFTGNIPDLSGCKELVNLFVHDNKLGGFFPYEVSLLTSLYELHMSNNKFTGTIPGELGSSTNLISLKVDNNQIHGEIPDYLFRNMNNLKEFYCNNNLLTGNIPTSLSSLKQVHTFALNYNKLISFIPPEIGNMTSLVKLHLYDNMLTGPIPTSIGGLGAIEELWLNDNSLSGPLPNEIGNLHRIETLYLEHNKFSDYVPFSFGNIASLKTFRIYDNNIIGTMPTSICELRDNTMSSLKYIAADCYSNVTSSAQIVCTCCDKCV